MFLLVGPKRGGKVTIGRVLTGLLGAHHVAAPTLGPGRYIVRVRADRVLTVVRRSLLAIFGFQLALAHAQVFLADLGQFPRQLLRVDRGIRREAHERTSITLAMQL